MSQKPRLVDPVHLFDERGHALSSYDRQEERIRALEAENARLKAYVKRVTGLITEAKARRADKVPPILH